MSDRVPEWYARVPSRAPASPPPPRGPGRGSCRAVNADTGLPCRLPAHVTDDHHDGRTRFTRVAAPGQRNFPRALALEEAATARVDCGMALNGWNKGDALSTKGGGLKRAVRRSRGSAPPEGAGHA